MPPSGKQQNIYQIPNSRPKKRRRWLKWLVIIVLTIAILIAVSPYLFALGLVISLKTANSVNNVWSELWIVPQEHELVPIADPDSGQSFTVGPLTFNSPIASTSIKEILPDNEGTKFIAGSKSFTIYSAT
jgi:ABC-type glycerol-3-phosphate transport system permease component